MSEKIKNHIALWMAAIDASIEEQVNAILHHPGFQALEASWLGVKMLVEASGKDKKVLIRMLNISLRELNKDMATAIEFDQSQLYRKVYSEEFDLPGGQPYGLLIGNYAFSHKASAEVPDPMGCLEGVSKVASAAFVPFVASISPHFFGVDSYAELTPSLNMIDLLKSKEYERWNLLQQKEESRYLGLVLPRILMRRSYQVHQARGLYRCFKEQMHTHQDYLWGNPAFAFACVVIQSFSQTGWFANIKGLHPESKQGGMVNLVRTYDATDPLEIISKISTEYKITDTQEKIFNELGLMVLKDNPLLKKGVFYHVPSLHSAPKHINHSVGANTKIATMLHYLMCANRFGHYIKVMIRDKIGGFVSASHCEEYLLNWLQNYRSAATVNMGPETKARYPLSDARVEVKERMDQPGSYYCIMHLKPHYQLDDIQSHLKLVTQIKVH